MRTGKGLHIIVTGKGLLALLSVHKFKKLVTRHWMCHHVMYTTMIPILLYYHVLHALIRRWIFTHGSIHILQNLYLNSLHRLIRKDINFVW